MNVDKFLAREFEDRLNQIFGEQNIIDAGEFNAIYFMDKTPLISITTLNHFKSKIRLLENHLLTFYSLQIQSFDHYESYSSVVAQSAKLVKPGDEIEITAGIGSFDRSVIPRIKVNHKLVSLNDRGVAIYKLKSPSQPGNYRIPIEIEFYDQDGELHKNTFDVDYTVARVCDE